MTTTRFVLVGGFLGAGKTTALARLALGHQAAGRTVGLITNDQAAGLVDTGSLQVRGLRVEEVAGGCFCCRFDDLARAADRLRGEERPQVLLAEPVGSCTDLVATVINPWKRLYGGDYSMAPYSVLLDPLRAGQMLLRPGLGGFSSRIAYIYRKQLEEADLLVLNKVDLLDPAAADAIERALVAEFPGRAVLRVSAVTGLGFAAWQECLERDGPYGRNILEIDYDTYAAGEAELGWLNATASINADEPFDADAAVLDLMRRITAALAAGRLEPAHLKVLFRDDTGQAAVASLVRGGAEPEMSSVLGRRVRAGTLVVNARAQADPADLRARFEAALRDLGAARNLTIRLGAIADFRPSRPVPVHRFDSPVV